MYRQTSDVIESLRLVGVLTLRAGGRGGTGGGRSCGAVVTLGAIAASPAADSCTGGRGCDPIPPAQCAERETDTAWIASTDQHATCTVTGTAHRAQHRAQHSHSIVTGTAHRAQHRALSAQHSHSSAAAPRHSIVTVANQHAPCTRNKKDTP